MRDSGNQVSPWTQPFIRKELVLARIPRHNRCTVPQNSWRRDTFHTTGMAVAA